MYGQHKEEGTLILRGNELYTGVLDKAHIGTSPLLAPIADVAPPATSCSLPM